jgi:hypothetical protein
MLLLKGKTVVTGSAEKYALRRFDLDHYPDPVESPEDKATEGEADCEVPRIT